jgi:hypothetical protein
MTTKQTILDNLDLGEIEALLSHFAEHADWISTIIEEDMTPTKMAFSLGRLHSTIRDSHIRAEEQISSINKVLKNK